MKKLMKNKKGDIKDLFLIMITLFVMAIISMIIFNVYQAYNSDMQTQNIGSDARSILNRGEESIEFLDYIFVTVLVMLVILFVVSIFMINTHPIFFVISLLLLIIGIVVSAIFSNTSNSMYSESIFTTSEQTFTFTTSIMDNLPIWILIIGVIGLIAIYAKTKWSRAYE